MSKVFKPFIISVDDAIKLFKIEEWDLEWDKNGVRNKYSTDYFEDFVSIYTGMCIEDYAKHKYPDNPETALKTALIVLEKYIKK